MIDVLPECRGTIQVTDCGLIGQDLFELFDNWGEVVMETGGGL